MIGRVIAALLAFATLAPAHSGQVLKAEEILYQNQYLSTKSGLFSLVMQSDGNLVRYFTAPGFPARTGVKVGAFPTMTDNGAYVRMQADGNLAMYKSNHTWAWTSGTGGNPIDLSYQLVLRESGRVEIWKNGFWWRTLSEHDAGTGSNAQFPFKKYINGVCTDNLTTPLSAGYLADDWTRARGGSVGYCNSPY